MECKFCKGNCQKAGRQKNGQQRFYCRQCRKYQQEDYKYAAYKTGVISLVPKLVCESVSTRGISRILRVALATACKQIKVIGDSIQKPSIPTGRKAFELDEVQTYIGSKKNQYWIAYALCSETRQVIDLII